MVDKNAVEDFLKAIQPQEENKDHTYNATVTRVDENNTVWVQVAGSDKETPTSSTSSEVKRGDTVNVQWRNNKLYVAGNYSNPSAGSVRVSAVEQAAQVANQAASNAVADAGVAREAAEDAKATADSVHGIAVQAQADADEAKASAQNASEYAARALGNLSTVQSVTETLTWITQHGTMALTTDVALDPTHVYFVVDAGGDYVVGGTTYAVVTEPDVADIGTYYELTIDESLNNYVGTHLALTSEGLWLLPASTGTNKVLIATGAGSVYTTAGTYIIDSDGTTVLASFRTDGTTIGIDDGTEAYQTQDYHSLQMTDINSNTFFWVSDLRDQSGVYELTDRLLGNGTTKTFYTTYSPSSVASVTINGVATTSYTRSGNSFVFTTAPANQAEVLITYTTTSHDAKAYTLGIRQSGSNAGPMSFASGLDTEASGSYAEAHNLGTVARGQSQTAIGQFNVIDDHVEQRASGTGKYAFIIGNGAHDGSRSNALMVDWNGYVYPQATKMVDFIVENGTNNSWNYRKWNSGRFDAWRFYQASNLTLTTSSAGTYYGDSRTLTMPSFTYSSAYICLATNTTSQSSGVYIYNCVATSKTTMTINYRAHASTSGGSCGGAFFVTGYWK